MERLNYNPLSLKDIAFRSVAAVLWMEPNILASLTKFHHTSQYYVSEIPELWRETVGDKIVDNISILGLPMSLTKQLIDTVKEMGLQLREWKRFHEVYLYLYEDIHFDIPALEKLCWTRAGAVDYRKTAEKLINSDVIDVVKRYKLACLYCFEEYIQLLWKELPEVKRDTFYKGFKPGDYQHLGLQYWWPYIIRGEQFKLDAMSRIFRRDQFTFHQHLFEYSAKKSNKAAAEYFFQKLTQDEKEASLIRTTRTLVASRNSYRGYHCEIFPEEETSQTLRYLLSLMTPDQQMRIFREDPRKVLKWFQVWPLQGQFSEVADLVWNFLPESDYDSVLLAMYRSVGNFRCYFKKLFEEFFFHIPLDSRKKFVHQECEKKSYFDRILELEDTEALEITFRSVDAGTRVGLVFSDLAIEHFHSFISRDKGDVIEVCLRETKLSKEDRMRLKEVFMGYLTSIGLVEMKLKTRKWAKFSQFPDETIASGKRCWKDETLTKAKIKKKFQLS